MTEKKELIISLGSNYDQEACMLRAKTEIRNAFGPDTMFSEEVWTSPIGIESDLFLNCLVFIRTSLKLEQLGRSLKQIESLCGNNKRARADNIVKMDIDILKYDGMRLHEKDWTREYVKNLMKACPFK